YPGGLALDNLGHLLVSTIDDGVKEYTTGGVPVNPALTAPGYNSATGILLDGNGHLFVANNYGGEGGNHIAEYTTSGILINENFITGLNNPVAMALIPEPSGIALLLLGTAVCGFKHRKRSGRA